VGNVAACLKSCNLFSQDGGEGESSGEQSDESSSEWWKKALTSAETKMLKSVQNGFKIELLLHILAYAVKLGDKVLVFSLSLKTLDFIEEVLSLDDWSSHIPSIASSFPNDKIGKWKKGRDFLRLDGAVNSVDRGDLISQFSEEKADENVRVFLISSKAGGMGINLVSFSVYCDMNRLLPIVSPNAFFTCQSLRQIALFYSTAILIPPLRHKLFTARIDSDKRSMSFVIACLLKER